MAIQATSSHRYREDIALMRGNGVSAYRFLVAWPRVLSSGKGAVKQAGLAFYDLLIAAKVEPWLCRDHRDLPQGLRDLGGWTNREIVGWDGDYAELITRRFGDRVKHFGTVPKTSTRWYNQLIEQEATLSAVAA